MAYKSREEIVGKRFLSVRSLLKPKVSAISEWEWRPGVVRAVSNRDQTSVDFTVLVEFDDIDWKKREWFRVHEVFQEFLVEHTLVWTRRPATEEQPLPLLFPALCYKPLVDKCGLAASKKRVVEFLVERDLAFVDDDDIHFYQEGDEQRYDSVCDSRDLQKEIRTWVDYQDGQKILLTTPVVLLGSRLEVYRAEGTTQWYTAFIHSINDATKSLTVTDDTVLESHNEDPALVQMRIIDNSVVHSILRGDVTPRRTSRQLTTKESTPQNTFGRRQGQQQLPSSGQPNRQVTVAPKARGHSAQQPCANSTPSTLQSASSASNSTAKQALGQDRFSTRSNKSQVAERRKRKSDIISSQTEDLKASLSNKRSKGGEEIDCGDQTTESDTPGSSCADKETSQEPNTKATFSSPFQSVPVVSLCSVSETKDRTVGKSLRSRKGSNYNNPSGPSSSSSSTKFSSNCASVGVSGTASQNTSVAAKERNSPVTSHNSDKRDEETQGKSETTTTATSSTCVISSTGAAATVSSSPVSTSTPTPSSVSAAYVKCFPLPTESGSNSDRKSSQGKQEVKDSSKSKRVSKKSSNTEGRKAAAGSPASARHGAASTKDSSSQSLSLKDATSGPSAPVSELSSGSSNTTKSEKAHPPSSSSSSPGPVVIGDDSEDTMHYKKQLLLAGGNSSPGSSTSHSQSSSSSLSASIDVNRSVTDQLTKLAKAEKITLGGSDGKADPEHTSPETVASSGTYPSNFEHTASDLRTERDSKVHDLISDRHRESSAFVCVKSNTSSSSSVEERAESRASDSQVSSGLGDDRRPGSRLDDLRSVKSSPTSSPLILDRNEPVNIYRDPELMSKNPVRSGLSVTSLHKTMSGPTYPSVPGGVPAPPAGLTTSTTLSSHPSSMSRPLMPSLPYAPHQLPPGAMSAHSLPMPHAFSQLDALAAREIAAAAQQQQQQHQQIAVLQQQYQNAAQLMHSMPYSLQGAPRMTQLELLWQQKFPHAPLPPAWLLSKQPDGHLGDALLQREQLERLEQERIERERMEKRLEIERLERDRVERMERERREKREKLERERQEREKIEKEKAERERAERERLERERIEKESKERERLLEQREWEQQQQRHQERERILRESADTSAQAAVDEHFVESFRLAKLRGIPGGSWVAPSITKGTGKGHLKMEAEKATEENERIKREVDQRLMMSEDKRYMGSVHDQRGEHKPEMVMGKDGKPMYTSYSPYHFNYNNPSSGPAVSVTKSEAIFRLYGFPSQHSTITTEQLQKKGLAPGGRPLKEEKGMYSGHAGNPSPPRASHQVVPPQHPKDMKPQSSVIVENKVKMEKPIAAHSHHSSSLSSSSSSSPRPQPRPAHTPEQRPDRPLSSSASLANPALPHHMMNASIPSSSPGSFMTQAPHPTAFRALDPKTMSRSQSPYKMGTGSGQHVSMSGQPPQQSGSQVQPINFSSKPKGISNSPSPYPPAGAGQQPPPVSLPSSSMAYSYSLIQQGLVPNPMYSQGTVPAPMHVTRPQAMTAANSACAVNSTAPMHGSQTLGMPPSSMPGKSQHSPPGSGKRKSNSGRDNGSLQSSTKRSKAAAGLVPESVRTGGMVSVPVTTPQVLANPSPYTTTSNSTSSFASRSSVPLLASSAHGVPPITGFMDSFKSFVENTVQNAFLQDEKTTRDKEERERLQVQVESKQQLPSQHKPQSVGEKLDTTQAAMPCEDVVKSSPSPVTAGSGPSSASGMPNSSSLASIMDTINRVANGQDTDSDTLSAPSPPPLGRSENASPQHRSGGGAAPSAPKLKKAWLQRHAGDKKPSASPLVPSPLVLAQDDSNSSQSTSKEVKNFLKGSSTGLDSTPVTVNGSVAPSPVPVSSISSNTNNTTSVNLSNGSISSDLRNTNDESTSSASETESQNVTSTKKRSKSKKANTSAKKIKVEEKVPSPVTVASDVSAASNNVRNKKNNKRSKNEKEAANNTKQKEKTTGRDSGSASPAPASVQKSPAPVPPQPSTNKNNTAPVSTKKEEKAGKSSSSKPVRDNDSPSPAPEEPEKSPPPPEASTSKDKKKTRRSKEVSKEGSAKNGEQGSSFNKPLVKCSLATLKRTGDPFIQDASCSEVTPKLSKCRECKMTPSQRSKKIPNIFCRFYAFRRLKFSPKGAVTIAGFSELSDADPDDIEPWLPRFPTEEPVLDCDMAKFILSKVGDKFCELVEQEKEAKSLSGADPLIAWKRAVTGVREMCDVCDTTLFNMHWVCHKCGFVVCLDCYKAKIKFVDGNDDDDCKWLTCSSNRQAHDARKLMLTQIIPSDALWELGRLIHDIRRKWSIPAKCPCGQNTADTKPAGKNGMNQLVKKMVNGVGEEGGSSKKSKKGGAASSMQQEEEKVDGGEEFSQDKLALLANVALGGGDKPNKRAKADRLAAAAAAAQEQDELGEDGDKKSNCTTLRELLTKTAGKGKAPSDKKTKPKSSASTGGSTLDDIILSVVEKSCRDQDNSFKFLHYTPRLGQWNRELPIIAHNLTETSVLYPDVPHSWLCDGRLLRLHDPRHKGNLKIFQEQWKRGQPVLVSCVNKLVNKEIWKPENFNKEFGQQKNDLVNCRSGDLIVGNPMSDFWEGFESMENRLLDEDDDPILLKLKDWPPGEDFSDMLPSHFKDLMQALPLPEYTQRRGKLNLASRLPEFLVRPDLGPKMYNAYGSAKFPKEGTTNLHLDISDAVNVLVYVGVPSDGRNGRKEHEDAAVRAIDEAGCDSITKRRVREVHEVPGALWQIYDAHDADKIRDFLNKVAKEHGEKIEPDHDSIHDQSWYLDEELRDRLLKEYGVQGYTIVQCLGDAIFIPAGAPHQVRNLHSCMKVAEDFVSPEHLNHCFRLTQEFRQLSDTHSNHEDKLQVKNIIYHAVKDSIAVLRELEPEEKK